MTEASTTATTAAPEPPDERPYSPGLAGVVAGETALSLVDGERGRLLYRGFRIGDIVDHGTYSAVANLLWTGEWDPAARLATAPVPPEVMTVLRALPPTTKPMDALRTAVSAWGAVQNPTWPPTVDQARGITAASPSALAAFARLRQGLEPIEPDPELDLVSGFLYQLNGVRPDPGTAKALDAYFMVGAEHSFNASTFTARVVISTRSDLASAVAAAIGTMKGPLHGGAPTEVVDQLSQIGTPERAEAWLNEALDRGERLMGFGHRVYRAYDPRAAALRKVAESMPNQPDWLQTRDRGRGRRPAGPRRAASGTRAQDQRGVLRRARPLGVGLSPDLFPATFSLARHAGWTAHALEQAAADHLIRPSVRYVGAAERDLPA